MVRLVVEEPETTEASESVPSVRSLHVLPPSAETCQTTLGSGCRSRRAEHRRPADVGSGVARVADHRHLPGRDREDVACRRERERVVAREAEMPPQSPVSMS